MERLQAEANKVGELQAELSRVKSAHQKDVTEVREREREMDRIHQKDVTFPEIVTGNL